MKEIKLRGRGGNHVALVDDCWYEILSQYNWYVDVGGYAFMDRTMDGIRQRVFMHRYIMLAPDGLEVDHINHNTSDNRTENLRIVRKQKNIWNSKISKNNTTGYKGVCWDKSRNAYYVYICKDRHTYHVGRFETKEEAALAYNKKAIELFGENAWLNPISEEYLKNGENLI